MSIELSRETEMYLAAEAQRRGVSIEALLQRFIEEYATPTRQPKARPNLPVRHLGNVGALHRRDFYDDAR